ncbi:uncharacterized protein LOC127253066 isoform X2 [Andrographis paniculata]|uniref:uncharacterized protein LOC127253066 isoform X2 n=1 Tax=Andrographis paniculata TaxID=175694 RepID=UPI0021E8C287|nr:uncharacterized protein LOC127253066 isoform X2 [Andrographis paniculata]
MARCFNSAPLPFRPPHSPSSSSYSTQLSSSMSRRILVSKTLVSRRGIQPSGAAEGTRVFVVSDLHTDYEENMEWVKRLSDRKTVGDVLLVAGDVAETYANFVQTMSILKDKFGRVFFTPGNHDLWLRRESSDLLCSLDKLDKLIEACHSVGVDTKPDVVDGIGIIPLYSWYHESFDTEKDITGIRIPPLGMACKDFHVCKWPDELQNEEASLARYFDSLNDENSKIIEDIMTGCSHIISFSHFLPRQELCPEKRMLYYPNLPKMIGSKYLESRIRAIHGAGGRTTSCHVFGHTHFCWDAVLDGIRYVQAPLAYPRERRKKVNGGEDWLPLCLYSGRNFAEKLSNCYWSDYYNANPRTPDITQPAPWVTSQGGRNPSIRSRKCDPVVVG